MTAFAGTIGPSCGSCFNSIYSLSYSTVSIGAVIDTYDVFVNINTTSYNGSGAYINAVAPKIISSSYVSLQLLSAPASAPGGSSWVTPIDGGVSAGACNGAGSGFFCEQSNGLGAAVSNNSNSWSFRVGVTHGTALLTGTNQASLKALFVDSSGKQSGIFSENISLTTRNSGNVPEPGTIGMIGAGLLAVGTIGRRRLKK